MREQYKRGLIDVDRRDGDKSLSIDAMGDLKFFWATTGNVAAAGVQDVYLTTNAEAGGEGLFSKVPSVVVYADQDSPQGELPRGHGPLGATGSYCVAPHGTATIDWSVQAKCFYVRVTNDTGTARDFVVTAQGV